MYALISFRKPTPPQNRQLETSLNTESDLFIDNLLVEIHSIIERIWWTGLVPREFEFPFPGSLVYTLLVLRARETCVLRGRPSSI